MSEWVCVCEWEVSNVVDMKVVCQGDVGHPPDATCMGITHSGVAEIALQVQPEWMN